MTKRKAIVFACLLFMLEAIGGSSFSAPIAARNNIVQVGKFRVIQTIAEAARQAKSGDVVEIDAGDYFADVASWAQEKLTIRAVNGRARLIAGGADSEGKGIWVIKGGDILIDGIDFIDAKVADGNGAGIRFEQGRLVVRNCIFRGNENGILTAFGPLVLEIENSEFDTNGTVNGLAHGVYAGNIKLLKVSGSYFHHARGGHLLKSRALENHIYGNRLTDEIGGQASYELEFPNGGLNYVIGNIIEQGSDTQNPTIIAVGLEGYNKPRNELYLINNTIVDDRPSNGIFLNVRNGIQKVKAVNNLLIGSAQAVTGTTKALSDGTWARWGGFMHEAKSLATLAYNLKDGKENPPPPTAAGEFASNLHADWDQFMLAARYDYRLKPASSLRGKAVAAGTANGIDLTQRLQYVHPRSAVPLSDGPRLPGAMQLSTTN